MAIEPEVLGKIGELLESGLLDPDMVVVDQEDLFVSNGVCAFDLLDTLMAIEHARVDLSLDIQSYIVAEYQLWTVKVIKSYWDNILDVLQNQDE